jgi:hypothetical protein
MSRPGMFSGRNVVAARAAGGPVHTAETHGAESHGNAMHARTDRPPNATGQHGEGAVAHRPEPAHNEPSRAMTRADRPPVHAGAGTAHAPEHVTPPSPAREERTPVAHAPMARQPAERPPAPRAESAPRPQSPHPAQPRPEERRDDRPHR